MTPLFISIQNDLQMVPLNKLQLKLTHFKRNQTFLTLIEQFLWPIFSKIDLQGFQSPPPHKKCFDRIWKKKNWDNLLYLSFKMSYYATL